MLTTWKQLTWWLNELLGKICVGAKVWLLFFFGGGTYCTQLTAFYSVAEKLRHPCNCIFYSKPNLVSCMEKKAE
jgi:hypothetical protein